PAGAVASASIVGTCWGVACSRGAESSGGESTGGESVGEEGAELVGEAEPSGAGPPSAAQAASVRLSSAAPSSAPHRRALRRRRLGWAGGRRWAAIRHRCPFRYGGDGPFSPPPRLCAEGRPRAAPGARGSGGSARAGRAASAPALRLTPRATRPRTGR